jgi:hypothetical protein
LVRLRGGIAPVTLYGETAAWAQNVTVSCATPRQFL